MTECAICGRRLRSAPSVAMGVGPRCAAARGLSMPKARRAFKWRSLRFPRPADSGAQALLDFEGAGDVDVQD